MTVTAKSGLDIMGITTLFQSIANERKTGNLKIQNDFGSKYVYFRTGNIVQVSSSQKPSILAEGLRRHPDLDEASYRAVCEEQRKSGKSLAAILSAEEDGQNLITAICQFQILEEICELFTWDNCHYEFTNGDADPMLFDLDIVKIESVDTGMILLEGARRTDEWKVILQTLPSKKDVPHKTGKAGGDSPEEKKVLAAIDDFHDVEDILSMVRLSPFEAMSTLASLAKKGVVSLKTDKELLQMAKMDVFRENLNKRIRLYERATELGEKSKEITVWLANAYDTMGMRDKAALQFSKYGYSCLQSDAYSDSIGAFEKAVQLNPEMLDVQERLISLLAKTNRMPEYAGRVTTFARWLAIQGDKNRALLILRETTEKYPQNLDNLDLLGSLYQECGYRQEAVHVYSELARVQIANQNYNGAARTYQKMLLLESENLDIRKSLAEMLEKVGRLDEARDHYRIIGKSIFAMNSLDNKKLGDQLISVSQKILEKEPNDLTARKWLADTFIARNEPDKATEQLKEILKRIDEKQNTGLLVETLKSLNGLHPQNLDNRFKLAEIYVKTKREREAVQEYFAAGITAAEAGQVAKALEAYDRLLNADPSNYAVRLKKAELLIKQQKNGQAIDELMLTGYLSVGADKLWQAVKAFRQIITLDRDNARCYLELGKVYERLAKTKEAITTYKKHVQKNVRLKNFGEAIASCQAILRLDPKNTWAQAAYAKLSEIAPQMKEMKIS